MRGLIFVALLTGCGSYPSLRVGFVASEVAPEFETIRASFNDAMGAELITEEIGGIRVRVRGDLLDREGALGVFTTGPILPDDEKAITIDTTVYWNYRLVTLTHEIGHALGLAHSDHGLMDVKLSDDQIACVRDLGPGECLRRALCDAGKVPERNCQ